MNAINEITLYLVQTVIGIYLLIMLMRFVLQLSMADFYNPVCQFRGAGYEPLVLPVRRILPARAVSTLLRCCWLLLSNSWRSWRFSG